MLRARHRRGARTAIVVVLVLLALVAARRWANRTTVDPLRTFDPAFYVTPEPMPAGSPGDVLRTEQLPGAEGSGPVWRVLYRSESLAGAPIAVSGIVAIPPGEPPPGGWPVLSLAHGTVGIGDSCTPSHFPGTTASETAKAGFVVVASDYEGLGTEGRHPYLVGESEARGVIDAVRAARAMDLGASDQYAVVGYSQGGHAALFANQIAPTWAPELRLAGVVAGAPVVELRTWLDQISTPELGWLRAMIAAGFNAADPAADPALVLTPDALAALPVLDDVCTRDLSSAFSTIGGEALAHDLTDVPQFAGLVDRNTPGQVAGAAPLLVLRGGADTLIRPSLIDAAVARLCGIGQTVEVESYPGVDHEEIIAATIEDALDWVSDRLAGEPASSTC